MVLLKLCRPFILVSLLLALAGCGGSRMQAPPQIVSHPPAPITGLVSVSIFPAAAQVQVSHAQQFEADVANTTITTVTWWVDGIIFGNSTVGTVSASGLYTAPGIEGKHQITAISSMDPTRKADAQVAVTLTAPPPPPAQVSLLTRHYGNDRTGANTSENVLTPANVNPSQFGKLFAYAVDADIYGQPLYVANLQIPGKGPHNVVYVATENDSVYAFDADGRSFTYLWKTSFLNPADGVTTVPCAEVEGCSLAPNVGITATPVIDAASNTIFVEARTKENGQYVHRLHALDIVTGAEKSSVVIQPSVHGIGDDNDGNDNIPFNPLRENCRPALLLSQGVVYVSCASFNDLDPYHGWFAGYDAASLQPVNVFNSTPNGGEGGFWEATGPAADAAGNIFTVAGNGTHDPAQSNFGQSVIKLTPAGGQLQVSDFFMPFNVSHLNFLDLDMGSGGPLLLPDQPDSAHPHLLAVVGKEGKVYLLDRDALGGFNPAGDQVLQELPDAVGTGAERCFATPAYWQGKLYFFGANDALKAFSVSKGLMSTSPIMQGADTFSFPGANPVISANGNTNGIVWVLQWNQNAPGVLRAYDAANLSKELYTSNQAGARDALGHVIKFSEPTVVNGKVFVGTANQVVVYGLLP
jgi:hypothetical protein